MSVFSRQYSIDPYISTVWLFIFSTLTSLVLLLLFSEVQLPSKAAFWPTLINGILINGVSYILWFKAMNTEPFGKNRLCRVFVPCTIGAVVGINFK
ncbi:hypothetical protein AB6G58_00110 [Providencia huaxiensis]